MLKIIKFSAVLLISFINTTTIQADERDQWQQFRAQQGIKDLDAQFEEPKAEPEVRVEVQIVEKIVEVEKVVIKEVPVPVIQVAVQPQAEPEPAIVIPDADTTITVESDGYIFKLSACHMKGRNIKCELSILSSERDGDLHLYSNYNRYSSKLFDRNGNEYIPSKISMGNKSNSAYIRNQYIAGVTAKGSISFENVDKSTQSIAMLDLSFHDITDRKYKHVKFRNAQLSY